MVREVTESRPPAHRVLIVDDEEPIRTFVARVLRPPRYETATAADGSQAITIAKTQGPFDLLVTDLAMPGMSGDELARHLCRTDPALKILYLTGFSDRLFEKRSTLWEAEAFLEKPVGVQGLLEAVTLLLEGRIPPPRPARVKPQGGRVRVANDEAELVTLSVTGGLIHTMKELPVGSQWPVVLELPAEVVHLTGRVVSCEPTNLLAQTTEQASYAVALAFVRPPTRVLRTLESVCRAIGESATHPSDQASTGTAPPPPRP